MPSLTGSVVSGNGMVCGNRDLEGEDQALVDRLVEEWRIHRSKGLVIRHRTGASLNERLGPPTEGQPYGREVLKRIGKACGIAESDLSRMRWFAHLFATPEAFVKAHPQVNTWTGFKELLPGLTSPNGGDFKEPSAIPSRPALRGVTRSLTSLTGKLRGMESIPEGKPGEALREKLRVLIEVASSYLEVRTLSAALKTDSSPGDPARANAGDRSSG